MTPLRVAVRSVSPTRACPALAETPTRQDLTGAVQASLITAFMKADADPAPYQHWIVSNVFPGGMTAELARLPFPCPDLHGVSGKRELHNDQRHYFDAANSARFAICAAVAEAFQSSIVVGALEATTGAHLTGTYVRLEYAQDIDGFWLEPHTDLGVKRFTMLIYLNGDTDGLESGTDLYADPQTWAKRPSFVDNSALVFVPGANTWHGLARRPIRGVRRTVIMNYVTDEWRDREQLAYPDMPVRA
jgi:hypothetical protein